MGNVVQLCKFIECVKHFKHWICQVQMVENCGACGLDKSIYGVCPSCTSYYASLSFNNPIGKEFSV